MSCGCKKDTVELVRPDINLSRSKDTGLASTSQYITITHKGISAFVYYDMVKERFVGNILNTLKEPVSNITVEFLLETGESWKTQPVMLEAGQVEEVNLAVGTDEVSWWKATLESNSTYRNNSKPGILIDDMFKNGSMVNLEANLMKYYENYSVRKNGGVWIRGDTYAGRHQSYMLEEDGLILHVSYMYEHRAIAGTISNVTEKDITNISLKIIYDEENESDVMSTSVKAGQTKNIGFKSISWEDFEIYRPVIRRVGFYSKTESKPRVIIKDLF
jgi:hypothetical protein